MKKEIILSYPNIIKKYGSFDRLSHVEIFTDSRSPELGNTFLALEGERFNAMSFLPQIEGKIELVIFRSTEENQRIFEKYSQLLAIEVDDPVLFLQWVCTQYIAQWKKSGGKVITISGSNGKTTTKEMLYFILRGIFQGDVIATKQNDNNHLGVPFTILKIKPETKVAVIELGSNHPGELKTVCEIAQPDIAYVTNIGDTHLEFFKDQKAVFEEETYPCRWIEKNGGFLLLNKDDPWLSKIKSFALSFAHSKQADIQLSFEHSSRVVLNDVRAEKNYRLENPWIHGRHNFFNLVASFLLAREVCPDQTCKLLQRAEDFRPTFNRSQWLDYQGKKVFLDAYNANPSSMKVSLEEFATYCHESKIDKAQALIVLGEMKELGEKSTNYHRQLGQLCRDLGFSKVIYIGNFFVDFETGFALQTAKHFRSTDQQAKNCFEKCLGESSIVFAKASRSLKIEELFGLSEH